MQNFYKQRNDIKLNKDNYEKCLSFWMGKHKRLGKNSLIKKLSKDLIKEIILFAFYIDTIELVDTLVGHSAWVLSAIVYKGYLISASFDKTIRIWNTNGDCIKILRDHDSYIYSLCQFKNYVISGDSNGNIFYWENILEGQLKYKLKYSESAIKCFIEFNNNLVSGSWDGSIIIWNEEGKYKTISNYTGGITSLYSLNNNYFFSGSVDKKIIKWNNNYELIKQINTDSWVASFIIFNNFLIVCFGRGDCTIDLYDLELNFIYSLKYQSFTHSLIVFEGYLFTGSVDKTRIWDIGKGKCIKKLEVNDGYTNLFIIWNKKLVLFNHLIINIYG